MIGTMEGSRSMK